MYRRVQVPQHGVQPVKSFTDRVAVVTGAGSGIGRATAQALAQRGCRLALVDINAGALAGTAELLAHARTRRVHARRRRHRRRTRWSRWPTTSSTPTAAATSW